MHLCQALLSFSVICPDLLQASQVKYFSRFLESGGTEICNSDAKEYNIRNTSRCLKFASGNFDGNMFQLNTPKDVDILLSALDTFEVFSLGISLPGKFLIFVGILALYSKPFDLYKLISSNSKEWNASEQVLQLMVQFFNWQYSKIIRLFRVPY